MLALTTALTLVQTIIIKDNRYALVGGNPVVYRLLGTTGIVGKMHTHGWEVKLGWSDVMGILVMR